MRVLREWLVGIGYALIAVVPAGVLALLALVLQSWTLALVALMTGIALPIVAFAALAVAHFRSERLVSERYSTGA
jgi:ABC-type bacteriocin/lantibiotic exporter with double-glycine peptidase domain